MTSLILASRSPARANMLREAGVSFTVQAADVDEGSLKRSALARGVSPREIALELALAKAQAVVPIPFNAAILGADQTLELDGVLFDKPPTLADARAQLLALRGRRHQLHSAVACVQKSCEPWSFVASATLHVRDFSDAFLDSYLAHEGPAVLGCVGAYRLEGPGAQLFADVEGDYFTILGLPLLPLLAHLRERGALTR